MSSTTNASPIQTASGTVQVVSSEASHETIHLPVRSNESGARKRVGLEDLAGEIRNRIYLLAIEPQDIETQWLTKRKSLTHSAYQFKRSHLDAVEPWGVEKDTRILRPAYGRRAMEILKERRAKLNASKAPKTPKPKTRFRHRLAALLCASKKINQEATSFFTLFIRLALQAAVCWKSFSLPSVQRQSVPFHTSTSSTVHTEIPINGTILLGRQYTMENGSTYASV
jgi:hypothetical protein